MSDFEFEQPGSVEPAEPAPQEPVAPSPEGSPSPSDVTRAYGAEARRLESGEPSPAVTESHPVEPPATVAEPTVFDPAQPAFQEWLAAQVEEQAQQRALEFVENELGDIAPYLDEETLAELVTLMPAEVQEALARRAEQIEEALLLQDIQLADARVDEANQLSAEGMAELRALVDRWQAELPGSPDVDADAVFEALVEQWPDVALRIGEQHEVAVGLARQTFEELATEQIGERRAFGLIEAELRKVGVDPDPGTVLAVKGIADQLWPEVSRRTPDEQQAVHEAIAAAAGVATGFREPQSSKSITSYYAAKARQIRAAETGHRDGDPPLVAPGRSLPSLTTAKYAAEAAAIRARSGL